ncbi:MAG TPA: hypothetical protein VML55_05945 [Planctomycetaceae bacterium]|nr:hypothetical protein [Planctomycetaceae bacterium]
MAENPSKGRPGRKLSVDYNLEKAPLQSGRPEDQTDTVRSAARWKSWDIRQWSFGSLALMLVVVILGLAVVLEVLGVRIFSKWIGLWPSDV